MRERAEAVRARQVQVQQQQIGVWMLLEGIEQAGNAIGLQELTVGAGRSNGAPQRRAEQRMVIDNEDFIIHGQAPVRRVRPRINGPL